MASTSVHHLHAVIHHALEMAIKKGYVARNVAAAADPPPVKVKPKKVWTSEQVVTFYKSLHENRLGAAFLIAVACGLHASEISGLRWEDVDAQRGILHVRRNRQRVWKRGVLEDTPKLTAVQALLGHSDPATTSRLYQHFQASIHGFQTKRAIEHVLSGGGKEAIASGAQVSDIPDR